VLNKSQVFDALEIDILGIVEFGRTQV